MGRVGAPGLRAGARRLALSGTPFRSDTQAIPFVRYVGDEAVPDFEYGYADALADGRVVRPVYFPRINGFMEWIAPDGSAQAAAFDDALDRARAAQRLRTALSLEGEWLATVLLQANERLAALRRQQPDAGGLVIAADQEHAQGVADLLRYRCGVRATVAVSDDPLSSTRIARFAARADPWIVAVRMVSEGVDIPRLRVGVYATTTTTELFFRQAVGRFVRWTRGVPRQKAYLFIPDDLRLRTWATQIADARRHSLRRPERDGDETPPTSAALDPLRHEDDRGDQLSMFAALSAVVTGEDESSVFDVDEAALDRLDRLDRVEDDGGGDAALDLALPRLPGGPAGERPAGGAGGPAAIPGSSGPAPGAQRAARAGPRVGDRDGSRAGERATEPARRAAPDRRGDGRPAPPPGPPGGALARPRSDLSAGREKPAIAERIDLWHPPEALPDLTLRCRASRKSQEYRGFHAHQSGAFPGANWVSLRRASTCRRCVLVKLPHDPRDLGGACESSRSGLAVSSQSGVDRKEVDSVLKGFTDVVTAVVSKGEPVSISGFAKFVKVDRPARMGRNPQTQQPVRIKASKKARITPLKGFKDAVVKTSLAPKLERGVWPPAPAAKAAAKKTATAAKKTTAAADRQGAPPPRARPEGAGPEDDGQEGPPSAPAKSTRPAAKKTATRPAAKKTTGPQDHGPQDHGQALTARDVPAPGGAAARGDVAAALPGGRGTAMRKRRDLLHDACVPGVLEAVLASSVVTERSTSSAPITVGVRHSAVVRGLLHGQRAAALPRALRADGQPRPGRRPGPARVLPGLGAVGPRLGPRRPGRLPVPHRLQRPAQRRPPGRAGRPPGGRGDGPLGARRRRPSRPSWPPTATTSPGPWPGSPPASARRSC